MDYGALIVYCFMYSFGKIPGTHRLCDEISRACIERVSFATDVIQR